MPGYYELNTKRYQLTPVQQQVYTDVQQVNAHISNINNYLRLRHLDHALYTFHLMMRIYRRLLDSSIPFVGKEIIYEKVNNIREKIKTAFMGQA